MALQFPFIFRVGVAEDDWTEGDAQSRVITRVVLEYQRERLKWELVLQFVSYAFFKLGRARERLFVIFVSNKHAHRSLMGMMEDCIGCTRTNIVERRFILQIIRNWGVVSALGIIRAKNKGYNTRKNIDISPHYLECIGTLAVLLEDPMTSRGMFSSIKLNKTL